MNPLSIRITDHKRDFDQTVEIAGLGTSISDQQDFALSPILAGSIQIASSINTGRWTKVLANGDHIDGSDLRTDHVAVIDHHSGLMWAVESLGDPDASDDGITQEHCIERCKELRLMGFDDWQLPSRTQLAHLIDDTRHEPAIDSNLFPRVKPRWHWTSTPCAWSSVSAWYVSFYGGVVYGYPRYGNGFALACRRAGQ